MLGKASIIIVTHNSEKHLHDCLQSVFTQQYRNHEVIIVDNASKDNGKDFIRKKFPSVKIIESSSNLGFAGANNLGIKDSCGEYVVLLNADTVVEPNWLGELIKTAKSNPQVGVVGSKLLLLDGNLNSTGIQFNYKLGTAGDRGFGEPDKGQYDDMRDVVGVCFASALIKRELLDEIGGLDEKFFIFYEDVDYCFRARLSGYQVVYCPSSVVHHAFGHTGQTYKHKSKSSLNKPKLLLRNRSRVLLKNYGFWNMLKWGFYSAVVNLLISPMAYLKNREFGKAKLTIYATLWNLVNFPIRERWKIQRLRRKGDSELFRFSVWSKW